MNKYTKEEIEEAFRIELPYFYSLQQKVQQVDNGIIFLKVRKHQGRVTDFVIGTEDRHVLK